jgi:hypothetical protein
VLSKRSEQVDQQSKIDIGVAIALSALGIVVIWLTRDFPVPKRGVGVSAFPRILSSLLILFSIMLIWQAIITRVKCPAIFTGITKGTQLNIAVLFLLIGYVAVLKHLGFLLSSMLLLFVLMTLFGERRKIVLLCVSIGLPFVLFLVFEKFAMVSLPQGVLKQFF